MVSAREVDVEHLLPQRGIGRGKGLTARLPRVVDQDVYGAKAGLGLLHCRLHGVFIGHIHGRNQHRHIGRLCAQRFGLGLQGLVRSPAEREATAR